MEPTKTSPKSTDPKPTPPTMTLSSLSDDVVLTIFNKLESDPRHWARLACVCTRFSSLIRHVCCPSKCAVSIPAVSADLLSSASSSAPPPGGWASLHKLAVCCPGLLHSGVLLEHSDFGLDREIGPDGGGTEGPARDDPAGSSSARVEDHESGGNPERTPLSVSGSDSCSWSLYDDLYFDTVYNDSEALEIVEEPENGTINTNPSGQFTTCKRRKISSLRSHLASGVWNLSREQGNKLLASRFRDDCLYICDWPGCMHVEEKRRYMLFRGVFKNFKKSRVWRTINDGNRSRIDLNCAFCACKQTWDLHSAFCLRRVFGYHDDGEPVVRAYVCENGHVSGAWTDWPLYT